MTHPAHSLDTSSTAVNTDSYFICATPRTGSSLLCELLESTGVAGHPESYFRQPDEQSWATQWDIVHSHDGAFSYADYVQAAIAAGSTKNGVFAARIMWGTLDEMTDKLRKAYPEPNGRDDIILNQTFGNIRFIYLRRDNVLGQAISWFRAEQTNVWHKTDKTKQQQSKRKPRFNFDEIHKLVQLIDKHNAAWQKWFELFGIHPHKILYEELIADPIEVTSGILEFLGLKLAPRRKIVGRHERLADKLSEQWIERYQTEVTKRSK